MGQENGMKRVLAITIVAVWAGFARASGDAGACQPHVFSMSCKVTCCLKELNTPEGRARAIMWWKANGFTKVWLESYRHTECVPDALLIEERDALRAEGFTVCGLITPTQLNYAPAGGVSRMVVCWSDPKARERMRTEVARVARIFDTVIVDDFLFSTCDDRCKRCKADKEQRKIADWGEYARALLFEVSEQDILAVAKAANPKARFIIKYPCWYQTWEQRGYSPARQAALFGECWVGTETRDKNKNPLQACWIMDHTIKLSNGACGGGWYDALDCTPEKFVEQGYYTILGGAKESLVHCYDYILAKDPGKTPFGEKARAAEQCKQMFEKHHAELRRLADFLQGTTRLEFKMNPNGVSEHFFLKEGRLYRARLNTRGEAVDGLAPHAFEFPCAVNR